MRIGEVTLSKDWQYIGEANTGEKFLIQNVSNSPVRFAVMDYMPDDLNIGGIVPPFEQLEFKRVSGDLYMRNASEDGYIYIERVEE